MESSHTGKHARPPKKITRRKAIGYMAGLGFLGSAGYAYAWEPLWPKAEQVTLALPDFPAPCRAVFLADLHFQSQDSLLGRVARLANDFDPDFVFFAGDLAEKNHQVEGGIRWLAGLKARRGKYFSPGNWDRWNGSLENGLGRALGARGITLLNNQGTTVPLGKGRFFLSGTDDVYFGHGDLARALASHPPGQCSLALCHTPEAVDHAPERRVDLMLSGHTHGGQIRFPLVGALYTPMGSGPYVKGLYQAGERKLYVTRGVGTSVLPVRVLCPPEVTLLNLVPQKN